MEAHGTTTPEVLAGVLEDPGATVASAAQVAMMRTEMRSSQGRESVPTSDSSSQLRPAELETTEALVQATEVTAK